MAYPSGNRSGTVTWVRIDTSAAAGSARTVMACSYVQWMTCSGK